MLRFIATVIFIFLFLVLSIPFILVEKIVGRFNKNKKDHHYLVGVQWAFNRAIAICGIKTTVIGVENIPTDEPVLYIGNHRSIFDIVVTYPLVPNLTGYVSKKEVAKVPLLATWMRNLNCLFLDRTCPREGLKIVLAAIEHIKNGISICIFPEGGRNKGEELSILPFKEGALKIATKTNCAIIPMSINNTEAIFEKQFPKIKKTHIVVEFGEPIYPDELTGENKKHIGAYLQNIIHETIIKNSELIS
jgi:1-acyl-sn-glycerol-3-phosphate acyltransferase